MTWHRQNWSMKIADCTWVEETDSEVDFTIDCLALPSGQLN